MKKSRVLSILLLVLSLHACSARSISFSGKQADNSQNLIKISSTHERLSAKYENSNYEDNKLNQFLVMKRNLKAHDEVKKEYNKELDEIIETTFQASQERAVEEKWKKEARRSTLLLPNGNNNAKPEETMNYSSNENEGPEEAVVMDYAQPHRKPPIHNKEP
ncbi:hypothetical protein Leryth_001653 [Lithospermum erythrorhizon]|uniref:Lipoprotein n=1 Tax=Lithospermum erythrorhizon TaxID=34254 RepID=A0AAV3RJW3_LITER|nr:hypothetical protein Leryth_001653 [Lithospermum erythrorhizon]